MFLLAELWLYYSYTLVWAQPGVQVPGIDQPYVPVHLLQLEYHAENSKLAISRAAGRSHTA